MASIKLNPFSSSSFNSTTSNTHRIFPKHLPLSLPYPLKHNCSIKKTHYTRVSLSKTKATLEGVVQQEQEQDNKDEIEKSLKVLKNAANTRKVPAEEVLAALSVMQKAKVDPSTFLNTLGGTESPGRTWMLIFTAKDRLKKGTYFPITAVQRFDAAGSRIENGVFFGPLGCLTFEGRFSWKNKILAFIFESIKIKVGPFGPLQIGLGQNQEREPNTKDDPFFIWFYIDEELAVAQGKGGGTAFWCRCRRVPQF